MSRVGTIREDYILNGVSLNIVDIEKDFKELKTKPILVNDLADEFSVGKTVDVLNNLLRTHYESDELDTVPSCKEGCTTGMYNYDEHEPVICSVCNNPVELNITKKLESQVWMAPPPGALGFMHPRIYRLFVVYFRSTNFCLIEYLTNPTYHPKIIHGYVGGKKQSQMLVDALEAGGVKRGINYFIKNFDKVMNIVLNDPRHLEYRYSPRSKAVEVVEEFGAFIDKYRSRVFTRYLPFPSKAIMISESGGNAEFIDPNMGSAFDAPKTIASTIMAGDTLSSAVIQSRTMKVVKLMSDFYDGYYHVTSAGKGGMLRGQHGGTRGFFTGRAVIAPLPPGHEDDEVHTPWQWSVTILAVHLENKLIRRGYTPREIFRIIDKASVDYCPLIDELFDELISECPEGGIPISMLRNPTLERGSNQYFRITAIIKNRDDNAILMCVKAVKAPNADFDGDQLQIRLLIDNKEKRQFSRLSSHLHILSTDRPNRIGGHVTYHPEVITTVNNFIKYNKNRNNHGRTGKK